MTTRSADAPASPVSLLHPSNLLTYAGVVLAATAATCATLLGDLSAAGAGIALAVIADTVDGRFSRRFSRTPFESAFGVQLDSLADAIVSGFVPMLVVMTTALGEETWKVLALGIGGVAYLVAALTRLGYYNLTESTHDHFVGLPSPAAALFVSTLLLFRAGPIVSSLVLGSCAVAMLAPFRMPRPRGRALLLFATWALLLVALHGLSIR